MLRDGVVYCQVSGCGSVAAYLLSSDSGGCASRMEAYCEFHATRIRDAGPLPSPSRKPSGVEMGRAKALKAKA
jgi:hypothetical protein